MLARERALSATAVDAESRKPPTIAPGTVLAGRYRIVRFIARGGMGEVFLGEHCELNKRLALKVAGFVFANEAELRRRFLQEARAASRVSHENIVDITDFGHTPDGAPFFAMEYLEGEDLGRTIARDGAMPWPRARHVILQVLAALSAAHAAGIIHRDIKPSNCFRISRAGDPDFIKVMDFGLAKAYSDRIDVSDRTASGVIMGTARYMSPEQSLGQKVDARTDVYSAGVMLFELLTGRPPFIADNFIAQANMHVSAPIPSPRRVAPGAAISAELEAALSKALAKRAPDRFSTAAEFADALRALSDGPRAALAGPAAGRRVAGVAAAVGLAALVGVVWPTAPVDEPAAGSTPIAAAPSGAERAAPPAFPSDVTPPTAESTVVRGEEIASLGPESAPSPAPAPPPVAKKARPRPAPAPPAPAPSAVPAPQLAPVDRSALLVEGASEAIGRCSERFGGFPGERVKVKYQVTARGEVRDVRVQEPTGASPLGHCIRDVLLGIALPDHVSDEQLASVFTL